MRRKNKKTNKLGIQLISVSILLVTWWIHQSMQPDGVDLSKEEGVALMYCIDGDTAAFNIDNTKEKVRFIAIDTPELKSKDYYAKEASDYTCNALSNAEVIQIVKDPKSDERDKYGRMIAWVYVDGVLLQEELVANGYAKVHYIYGDYMHVDMLKQKQKEAKQLGLGIWK